MTIYLDVVFIENLAMNYIILFATSFISKSKTKSFNLAISSFIGGIYAILSFIAIVEIYKSFILKIILSIIMIYIAFKPENIKKLFRELMIFYLVSFAFGGTAFALLYFIRPQDILIKNGILIGTYPIKIAFLGACVGFIIINLASKGMKNKISKKDMLCKIIICIEGKKVEVSGIIDTGNFLKEPITGTPVIVVENEKLKQIIPLSIIQNMQDIIYGEIKEVEEKYVTRLKILPFNSIGKTNGIMLGIKSDYITIKTEENNYKVNNVIIGMYNKKLSKDSVYSALVGLEILEGGTYELNKNAKV